MIAHITTNKNKQMIMQSMHDHSHGVAKYAQENCMSRWMRAAYFLGIIHDMGKCKDEFKVYLEEIFKHPERAKELRGTVNHTFASVIWILEHSNFDDPCQKVAKEILAFCVGAHHGLFDLLDKNGLYGLKHRLDCDKKKIHYKEAVNNFYAEVMSEEELIRLFHGAVEDIAEFIKQLIIDKHGKVDYIYFDISSLCRLLLSSLVYGDHRDTAEFMFQSKETDIMNENWQEACDFIEEKISQYDPRTPIDIVRCAISDQCKKSASREAGAYRLTVDTGGGKTRSSLRYGAHHALQHKKRRIIYVVSHITIIEQNAKVWREYFHSPEHVLECHSNVINEKRNASQDEIDASELLTELWDAPVVMTTFVQFLDALFSGKMTSIGRMCALNNSIIIFDEIQNMPPKFTYMFNETVNFLTTYCNCTLAMCSATQPRLEKVKVPLHYKEDPELVTLTDEQRKVFRRTKIIDKTTPHGMSFQELANFCKDVIAMSPSLLCICNTRKQAKTLYDMLKNSDGVKVLNLSNDQCKENIVDALNEAIACLRNIVSGKSTEKLLVISTQIPEAGVDISFASVIRVLAGLDNVLQSDGRDNRNNEYGIGYTYIVNLNQEAEKTQYMPELYAKQEAMLSVLKQQKYAQDLFSTETINHYYDCFFQYVANELGYNYDGTTLFNLLNNGREKPGGEYDLCIPFKEISEAYHAIEGDTTDVIVPYGKHIGEYDQLKDTLENSPDNLGLIYSLLKKLKRSVVSVHDNQLQDLISSGNVRSYMDGAIYLANSNAYSEETGIVTNLY